MKKASFLGFLFLAVALCMNSCSKEGPAGPQGEQGPQGPKGEQGAQGIPGANGSTIYCGNGAPTVDIGKIGDYYIDKGSSLLYGPKTDAGWGSAISLKGEKGDKGDTGAKGDKGEKGEAGKDGSQILSGASAPSVSIGNIGDYYWNTTNFTLYGPKTTSGWGNGVLLRGQKGDPGTANVMYSDWQKFNWGSRNPYQARKIITEPLLTEDFMNNGGVVLVYVRVNVNPFGHTYYQLPRNFSVQFNCRMEFYIRTRDNYLIIDLFPTSGNLTSQFTGDKYAFRYVLIPGGVHLRKSSPPPSPKDYKATCKYYGIPE